MGGGSSINSFTSRSKWQGPVRAASPTKAQRSEDGNEAALERLLCHRSFAFDSPVAAQSELVAWDASVIEARLRDDSATDCEVSFAVLRGRKKLEHSDLLDSPSTP